MGCMDAVVWILPSLCYMGPVLHSMQCRVYIHYVCPLLLPVYSTIDVHYVVYITT